MSAPSSYLELSEKRAKDRDHMAALLTGALSRDGVSIERNPDVGPREIELIISVDGGARVRVDFDGESVQPDVFVLGWHIDHKSDATFAPCMGDVNPFHHSKVTKVAYGFPALLDLLVADVSKLVSGEGYR